MENIQYVNVILYILTKITAQVYDLLLAMLQYLVFGNFFRFNGLKVV